MNFAEISLVLAVITTALMAGLFYGFSISVMPGLKRLSDSEFLAAMQSINRSIQNIVFFLAFLGAPLLLTLSTILYYDSPRFTLVLAASAVYLIGVFGVTIVGNIPLNNALDKIDLDKASPEQFSAQRASFEPRWNRLNTVRTIASTLSLTILIIAIVT